MTQLERFIHGGRLGRRLIVLMLIEAGVRQQPLLYISLFFMQHRSRYYELLDHVRRRKTGKPGSRGALRKRPLTSTQQLMELSGLSFPTASKVIETMEAVGIAQEFIGGRRNWLFAYDAYPKNPSEGAEPLSELDTGNCIIICGFHRINCKCAV